MGEHHHGVGQAGVQQDPDQPEGEENRAGDAVDVSGDDVDPGWSTKSGEKTKCGNAHPVQSSSRQAWS